MIHKIHVISKKRLVFFPSFILFLCNADNQTEKNSKLKTVNNLIYCISDNY